MAVTLNHMKRMSHPQFKVVLVFHVLSDIDEVEGVSELLDECFAEGLVFFLF